jgi:hypothetical protein
MQVFIIGGNQVGCLCWRFNAFVGFGNWIDLFVETLMHFIIIRIELASLLEICCCCKCWKLGWLIGWSSIAFCNC